MRYVAFAAALLLSSAAAADSTTHCYPIGGQMVCDTFERGASRSQSTCQRSEQDIQLVKLLIDRIVSYEVKALEDARLRIGEELSKMSGEELEALEAGTYNVHEDAIQRATEWLGRAPSPMAIAKWHEQRPRLFDRLLQK